MILCVTFGKSFGLGLFLCLLSWKTGLKKKEKCRDRLTTRCWAWTNSFQVNKLFKNNYDNKMLHISHVLLHAFTTGPKPISPSGLTWPQLRGGIWCQINRESHQSLQGILDCQRQHCDNSNSHPDFQPSSRLRPRPRANGFLLCRKGQGSYPNPQESPWVGLCGAGNTPQGQGLPSIRLVWILGSVPVVSTKRQATSYFP